MSQGGKPRSLQRRVTGYIRKQSSSANDRWMPRAGTSPIMAKLNMKGRGEAIQSW